MTIIPFLIELAVVVTISILWVNAIDKHINQKEKDVDTNND